MIPNSVYSDGFLGGTTLAIATDGLLGSVSLAVARRIRGGVRRPVRNDDRVIPIREFYDDDEDLCILLFTL